MPAAHIAHIAHTAHTATSPTSGRVASAWPRATRGTSALLERQTEALLRRMCGAYLGRFPQAAPDWAPGHLQRLATAAKALPTYLVMSTDSAVPAARLHGALLGLARRAETPAEWPGFVARVVADADAADDEFALREPELQQALADLEPALDYALLGLQADAALGLLRPATVRCVQRQAAVSAAWVGSGTPAVGTLHARLRLQAQGLPGEAWRAEQEQAGAAMFAQCGLGLRQDVTAATLPGLLAHLAASRRGAALAVLAPPLRRRFGRIDQADAPQVLAFAEGLADFVAQVQAVLRVTGGVQAQIQRLLGRSAAPPLNAAEMLPPPATCASRAAGLPQLPNLLHEMQLWLGARVHLESGRFDVAPAASGTAGGR